MSDEYSLSDYEQGRIDQSQLGLETALALTPHAVHDKVGAEPGVNGLSALRAISKNAGTSEQVLARLKGKMGAKLN